MRQRQTREGGSRHRGGCLYLLCILLLAMIFGCCAPLGGAYATLWAMKQDQAAAYRAFARDVFGVSPKELGAEYFLTEEGRALAEEAGLDPDRLALSLYIEEWADEKWGEEAGDWAIYYELTGGESGGCENCGQTDACPAYHAHELLNGPAQCAALDKFLALWREYDLLNNHSMESVVEQYLNPDYSGAKGSSAGALGCSQFLAGTAWPHCESGDVEKPCDLWNPETAMKFMAAELHRLGWQEGISKAKAVLVLFKWNRERVWVTGIAEGAMALRASLGQMRGCLRVKDAYAASFETTEDVWVGFLGVVGLMPEGPRSPEGMAIILDGEWQLSVHDPTILTSDTKDHIHPDRGSVPAWDLWGKVGTLVYPARAGVVNVASYGNEGLYGHWVKIDHGDGLETVYAHLGELLVEVGQEVDTSTPLGGIAQTGLTSWPHTHFEVRENGVQFDPAEIYGQPEEIGLPYVHWTNLPYEKKRWDHGDGDE